MDPLILILLAGGAFILLTQTNTGGAFGPSPGAERQAVTNPVAQNIAAGRGNDVAQDLSAGASVISAIAGVAKTIPWGQQGSTTNGLPGGTQASNNFIPPNDQATGGLAPVSLTDPSTGAITIPYTSFSNTGQGDDVGQGWG
jgi:hypothetical protein